MAYLIYNTSAAVPVLSVLFLSIKKIWKRFGFSNGRIHFRNARWYFLVEVVEEESADVEKGLWHVGAEGLVLGGTKSEKK